MPGVHLQKSRHRFFIALNLSYLPETETSRLIELIKEVGRVLNELLSALKDKSPKLTIRKNT
jgi:hypothetical protein